MKHWFSGNLYPLSIQIPTKRSGPQVRKIHQRKHEVTIQGHKELVCWGVNVNIRMYNFDDVQCTVIPSVAYGFVTGMNLQLC